MPPVATTAKEGAMTIATRRYTHKDLDDTPDDGKRYEIIGGELIVSAAPVRPHQKLLYRFTRLVGDHVDERGFGEVYFAPVDVEFSEEDVVQPDLLFLRADRLDIYQGNTVYGPPDVVLEIHSPSSSARDKTDKFALYERGGVREYWQADPAGRTLTIHWLNESGRYERVEPVDGVLRSRVLPDLRIDVAALFAGLS
jgi:Uma2 family endonuclease